MAVKFLTGLNVEGNVIITPLNTTDTISFLNLGSNQSRLVTTNNFAIFNGGLETARFFTTGAFKLAEYGSGTFTGTATQRLGVDTSGNVIEIPIGSGAVDGSGTTNFVAKWLDTDTIGNSVIFDNGARVGIANPNPLVTLDVEGAIRSNNDNSGDHAELFCDFDVSGYSFLRSSAGPIVIQSGATETIIKTLDSSFNAFLTVYNLSDVAAVKLNSFGSSYLNGGNVGIGTTSPSAKLDVAGTGKFTGQVTIPATPVASTDAASKSYVDGQVGASGTLQEVTDNGNTTTNSITFAGGTSTGNILINRTDSTEARLTINTNKSFGRQFYLENKGNVQEIVAENNLTVKTFNNDTQIVLEGGGSTDNIQFITDESEGMRITSAGNVGIGTTSPSEKLDVVGNIKVADEGEIYIQGSTSARKIVRLDNTTDKGLITLNRTDTTKVVISADFVNGGHTYFNGLNTNVGIGTDSPLAKLDITSTTDGVLLPRMTTTQVNAISSPENGLTVYNTTLNTLCFYNGSSWQKVTSANMPLNIFGPTFDETFN